MVNAGTGYTIFRRPPHRKETQKLNVRFDDQERALRESIRRKVSAPQPLGRALERQRF